MERVTGVPMEFINVRICAKMESLWDQFDGLGVREDHL